MPIEKCINKYGFVRIRGIETLKPHTSYRFAEK